ncbi:MAG TPA: dethiobiotin synthase [Chitinolyticbacter sp.]|nr:dethiobiotin synthase [Chitinolyticbacter sp.]
MTTLFITGTDTEVGKTVITCQLLRAFAHQGLRALAMKPVASGCVWQDGELVNADVTAHAAAANVDTPLSWRSPYRFEPPISPHLAAREANIVIELDRLAACATQLAACADIVLVEGAGGWYAPLSEQATMADLAARLHAPVILVVGMRLGCINHALLTVEAIAARGLRLAGWVANTVDPTMSHYAENVATLCARIDAPLLAEVGHSSDAEWGSLPSSAVVTLLP